jgi:hypothetical protein
MTDQTMTGAAPAEFRCPKDATAMAQMGRWPSGADRCPACKSVFLDMPAMRSAEGAQPPVWALIAVSILMSVGMTLLVRRLRHASKA